MLQESDIAKQAKLTQPPLFHVIKLKIKKKPIKYQHHCYRRVTLQNNQNLLEAHSPLFHVIKLKIKKKRRKKKNYKISIMIVTGKIDFFR